MAGRRIRRVRAVEGLKVPQVEDPTTARALDVVGAAIEKLQERRGYDVIEGVDLAIGKNAIVHRLGRAPKLVLFTPTVADAAFAFAVDNNNAQPERQVFITVIGAAQPGVSIFLM